MAGQYYCADPRRLIDVRTGGLLNGIDSIEVLDQEAPPGTPRQCTLLVRCILPVMSLTRANVRIEGGVRVTSIGILWAHRADALPQDEPMIPFYLDQPDHVLVVRTDVAGDFSTYVLKLVAGEGSESSAEGFDPILAESPFTFKPECDTGFDCRQARACLPEAAQEPLINYLAKDYGTLRQLLMDRLSVTAPDWTERNPADLGVAIIELMAYAADELSYHQDAVATEAYLGTARGRAALRRHTRLLDYPMHEGCNARVWVVLTVSDTTESLVLPSVDGAQIRTRFLTKCVDGTIVPPQGLKDVLSVHQPEVFEPTHDVVLYRAHNEIPFYTWSDKECCLPKGATRATLRDGSADRLRLLAGDVLIFEEVRSPAGIQDDADPTHRHAVRLIRVDPAAAEQPDGTRDPGPTTTDPVTGVPIVEIQWADEDALPFPLCVSSQSATASGPVSLARGNVVLVDHGRTQDPESLPEVTAVRFRPALKRAGVTHRVVQSPEELRLLPASTSIRQDPRQALPALELSGDRGPWEPRHDLLGGDAFDPGVVVETDDDGTARLRFGDNVHGRAPTPGAVLTALYRTGNGAVGNVGGDSIRHIVSNVSGIAKVRNPLPGAGGTDPELASRVRLDAPEAFRVQERAVTGEDHVTIARRYPTVQRAVASRRWTGSWTTMFVTVDRFGAQSVDDSFEAGLSAYLGGYVLAGRDVEVEPPRYVPLDIAMTVCVESGHFQATVKEALAETFSTRELPAGVRGFFHPDEWTFGEPVYLSRVIQRAMSVSGVSWVDLEEGPGKPIRFRRWGQPSHGESQAGVIPIGRTEIARLDNDPNAPENGRIVFLMRGGA